MFDAGKKHLQLMMKSKSFQKKDCRVSVDLVQGHVCHLENLKLKRDKRSKEAKEKKELTKAYLANQFEETETEEEFESEKKHEADEDENLILNIVQDGDEESDEEELMFVPNIRTATGGKHSDVKFNWW